MTERKRREPKAPVRVDNLSRRSGDDALEGSFVDVIDGEYKGVRGAFTAPLEHDPETGYPSRILVRGRDHQGDHDLIVVNYKDVRPAVGYNGGR